MSNVHVKDVMKASKDRNFDFVELEREMSKVGSSLTYNSSPFYASVLMQCARIYTFKIPTLAVAVTQQVLLFINPDFFMGRMKVIDKATGKEILVGLNSTKQREAVVEHELLHLILHHVTRARRHLNHELSNLAADAVCNQYVRQKLPGDAVTIQNYQLPENKDLDHYYNLLKSRANKGEDERGKPQKGQKGQKGEKGDKGSPGQGEGGDPSDENSDEDGYANPQNGRGSHDMWGDGGGEESSSSNEQRERKLGELGVQEGGLPNEVREAIVTDVIRQAAAKDGKEGLSKLPGNVAAYIEEMLRPKKATQPWNVILRRFTGTHGGSFLKQSRKYLSKRFSDAVTGLKCRPGLRIRRFKKILVGIDTSGSMQKEDLELLAGELAMIWRYNKDIWVAECDTTIHKIYKFNGRLESVCGRGGTDMWPIRNLFEKGEYDCCILMTDGQVGDIGEKPPRKGWLWVITHGGSTPASWGLYVHLPDASTVEDA